MLNIGDDMRRSTSFIIALLGMIMIITGLIILDKDMMLKLDNYTYKYLKIHIVSDNNTRINKDEIIKIAKNKNYKDSVMYPYYELLNKNEKIVYDKLLELANKYEKVLKPSVKVTLDEVKDIYNSLMYDHPEIFWLDNNYTCTYDENNIVIKIELNYTNIINKINIARSEFDKEVNNIVEEAKKLETDYEKELYVHDTLINKIKYDSNEKNDQSAYGALVLGNAVCVGYAKSFQIVMNKLGIPTYYIVGMTDERHAWNLIELEDGFYNVDLTFDDGIDKIYYKYFNVSNEMISKDHKRENLSLKIDKENGKKYINTLSSLK